MKNLYSYSLLVITLVCWQPLWAGDPVQCQISLTGGKTIICQGQPLVLISQLEDNGDLFTNRLWQTDGRILSVADGHFVRFDTSHPGIFNISFSAWNDEGEKAFCETRIEVTALPDFEIVENFGLFGRFLFKKPMPRLNIIPAENYTFQWFFNEVEISGAVKPRFKPRQAGTYHAKVTSQQGCAAFSKAIIIE